MPTPDNRVEIQRYRTSSEKSSRRSFIQKIFAIAVGGGAAAVFPLPDLQVRSAKASPMVDGPLVCVVDGSYAPSEKNPDPLNIDACAEIRRLTPQEGRVLEASMGGLSAEDSTISR